MNAEILNQACKIEKAENKKAEPAKPTATASITISNPPREAHNGNGLQTHDGREFTSSTRFSLLKISSILNEDHNDVFLPPGSALLNFTICDDISLFAGDAFAGCSSIPNSPEISCGGISPSGDAKALTTIPNSQMHDRRNFFGPITSRPFSLKISSILNDSSNGGSAPGPLPYGDGVGYSNIPSSHAKVISNSQTHDERKSSSPIISHPFPLAADDNCVFSPSGSGDASGPLIYDDGAGYFNVPSSHVKAFATISNSQVHDGRGSSTADDNCIFLPSGSSGIPRPLPYGDGVGYSNVPGSHVKAFAIISNSQMHEGKESSSPIISRPLFLKISSILNDPQADDSVFLPSGGGSAPGPLLPGDRVGAGFPSVPDSSGISSGSISLFNTFNLLPNSEYSRILPPVSQDSNLINNNSNEIYYYSLPPINSTSQKILLYTLEPKPDLMEDQDSQIFEDFGRFRFPNFGRLKFLNIKDLKDYIIP
ncbi:hypothetical protein GLOIN_2v1597232 [Rhizophagus clarus]|uniref:Uncharacterized protein n=1 Tax=Rhizophagus clarus TaxID=94130 RepID=A0A8H3LUS2_9GLOM|nr:hypothetical protein GLOIN_2v1597232 [Rhizophagus clarus]